MAEELLSLKWNNHQAHFVDILTLLREKDMFIDATIACGGKVYSAHKFVLSTCSDYFKQIFTRSPTSNPIVFMKDVSCRDIEALLDFMYNGEVSVPQSSLGSLIKTAEGLQIKGLAVPDDPPSSRRQQERDKRERDPSLSFPENRSPPPKRRVREKNTPPRRLSNHQQSRPSNSTIDNSSLENNLQINNDLSDNSSGLTRNNSPGAGPESSAPSDNNTSKKQHNNVNANSRKHSIAEEEEDEDRGGGGGEDSNHDEDSADNGSLQQPQHDGDIGAAAVTHSKHEEMEIKQEDVVDLGEDDEGGEWGDGGGMGDGGADDGGVGGNDSLSSADNTVNFSDVLLAHSEGGALAGGSGAAGDSAMTRLDSLGVRCSLPPMLALHGVRSSTPTTAASGISAALARRPHVCSFCGRRFKRKDHKTEHERIHTGERPYPCSFCSAAFVQKQQLVGHQRRRHGVEPARGFVGGLSGGEMFHPDGDDLAAAVNAAATQHQHHLAAASSGHDLEQLYHHADNEDAGLQSHHEELIETSGHAHQRGSNRSSRQYHQHSSHQHHQQHFLVHQDVSVNGRGSIDLPQSSCLLPGSNNRGLGAPSSGSSHNDLPLAHLTALAEAPRPHISNR